MNFKEFIKNEGLKRLALTKLKSASFSILIYLFNEILSGANEIIASRKELSILLGWSQKQITEGLEELKICNFIHMTEMNSKPLRIRPNLNIESWNNYHLYTTQSSKKPTLGDTTNLHPILNKEKKSLKKNIKLVELNALDEPIPFPKKSLQNTKTSKKSKINLSQNTLKDLEEFREKHEIIDTKIKTLAQNELDIIKHEKRTITPDEELLLQILSQHHQPRKQLIWALKSNLIYPNLKFFLTSARICADIPDPHKK